MKTKLTVLTIVSLLTLTGCPIQLSHFGVTNEAILAPSTIKATQAVIEEAERSTGGQYCPEKIARAKELAKKGTGSYWAFRDEEEAMTLLAQARRLAKEAEECQPPAPIPTPKPRIVTPSAPQRPALPRPPSYAAVPKPPPLKRIIMKGVNFAFASSEISSHAKAILAGELTILKEHPYAKFEIAGHTDSIGPEVYNQFLSEKRGEAVKDYLISKGVKARRIKVIGYGESMPIATNDTKEGRAKNRRVEIDITR